MARGTTPGWSRRFDRATLVLATAAGLGLLFMVATIAAAVIMRYVAGTPLLGVNEVVQLTAVAVAMLALPYCTDERAHVRVDVLDNAIGPRGRWFGDVLSRLLSGFVLSVLVWRAGLKALDAWEYGDTTNMLGLPIWPFYGLISLGIALCVLVLAEQLLLILVTRRELE
ncbi:TRAP transporter small permease [Amaricoccus solimangrovi]|uniref:TRAP transporter small permease protein n=1 Tax=Amaricoccus solimangrovi TaxID=2589815 RepID=A0A501W2C1_9RHOB|nr:TRAP transporter small permease [Amaricoccus solimangrovi]TPE43418.1 TRAP transporter small permease [Amaricoccus solimangrovi]